MARHRVEPAETELELTYLCFLVMFSCFWYLNDTVYTMLRILMTFEVQLTDEDPLWLSSNLLEVAQITDRH